MWGRFSILVAVLRNILGARGVPGTLRDVIRYSSGLLYTTYPPR